MRYLVLALVALNMAVLDYMVFAQTYESQSRLTGARSIGSSCHSHQCVK